MNDSLTWVPLAFIAMGIGIYIGCILLKDDTKRFILKKNNKILSVILSTSVFCEEIELSREDIILLKSICQCYYRNISFKQLPQVILNLRDIVDGKLDKPHEKI